jgi:hypothetical protein
MWYGLCTQSAKDEAEAFANRRRVERNSETIGNIVIKQSFQRDRQAKHDEARWKEMKRSWGGRLY